MLPTATPPNKSKKIGGENLPISFVHIYGSASTYRDPSGKDWIGTAFHPPE
jgi:hypothetical protein